jgi:hypothetical protein
MGEPIEVDLEEIIATSIRDHSPTTGMRVASGETCRCGYWNGVERAGVDRPVGCGGLTWHQAQEAAAKIREAAEGGA